MTRAYLSLGSNQGDRLALLHETEARLGATTGIRVVARSSVYETEPVGLLGLPWFLNRVLAIETSLDPHTLLGVAQQVETSLGRTRAVRWGARAIDIDVLLYGKETVASERLTIPHPELINRRFVLVPLAEIDPLLCLPDGRTIRDLLQALGVAQAVIRIEP